MTFAGINYIAVLIAAAAGWVAGAAWYMALAKPWMAAVGTSKEKIEQSRTQPGASLPFMCLKQGQEWAADHGIEPQAGEYMKVRCSRSEFGGRVG